MVKKCVVCGASFSASTKRTYCSEACRLAKNRKRNKKWRDANPTEQKEIEQGVRERRIASGKADEYRRERRARAAGYIDRFLERARKETPDTDIDRALLVELMADETCIVTGVPFRYSAPNMTSFSNPYAPSIDRIDSARGYYRNNIQIVLIAVNLAKNQLEMSDFIAVWRDIVSSWAALTRHEVSTNG